MENNEVRALCALITLDTNPRKCEALIAELTKILASASLTVPRQTAEEQRWRRSASQGSRNVG
jgi:hypothetical protein